MNPLYILTTANDKTASAVTSLTDSTPVSLEQLVLGDVPAMTIYFTDGTAAPSWAGQAGYTFKIGLGTLDTGGAAAYTSSVDFVGFVGGWAGRLNLNTQRLIEATSLQCGNAINWTPYPLNTRTPQARPQWAWFNLQISVQDPDGYTTTYAELRIPLLNRVLPNGVATTTEGATDATARLNYVINLWSVAAITGGTSVNLDGQLAGTLSFPLNCVVMTTANNIFQNWRLVAGYISATNLVLGQVKPINSDATTNPVHWQLMITQILPIGPSQTSIAVTEEGSTTTIIPQSQFHTHTITATGVDGSYVFIVQKPEGMAVGARIDLVFLFPLGATNGMVITIYAVDTDHALFSFVRNNDEPSALFSIYVADDQTLQPKVAVIPAFAV